MTKDEKCTRTNRINKSGLEANGIDMINFGMECHQL
jgi:hypothetical protein